MAYESSGEAKDLLDEAERRIFEIARLGIGTDIKDISSILQDTFNRIEMSRQRSGRLTGLETGFHDLDDLTSGFQNGELLILAARPSMGTPSPGCLIHSASLKESSPLIDSATARSNGWP